MIRAVTIDLIKDSAHGVFETPEDHAQTVFAEIRSVTRSEMYQALSAGLNPELIFRLADYADYGGERLIRYDGKFWRVLRTYTRNQTIELTVQEEVP